MNRLSLAVAILGCLTLGTALGRPLDERVRTELRDLEQQPGGTMLANWVRAMWTDPGDPYVVVPFRTRADRDFAIGAARVVLGLSADQALTPAGHLRRDVVAALINTVLLEASSAATSETDDPCADEELADDFIDMLDFTCDHVVYAPQCALIPLFDFTLRFGISAKKAALKKVEDEISFYYDDVFAPIDPSAPDNDNDDCGGGDGGDEPDPDGAGDPPDEYPNDCECGDHACAGNLWTQKGIICAGDDLDQVMSCLQALCETHCLAHWSTPKVSPSFGPPVVNTCLCHPPSCR